MAAVLAFVAPQPRRRPSLTIGRTLSTCPRCKGHLTDSHRCPRRPGRVAAELATAAVAGGAAGLLLVALLDPDRQIVQAESVAILVGAIAAVGLDRFVRR
jgi:hypothetical protein